MAELKTKKRKASVAAFLKAIPDETQRADCRKLLKLMQRLTGEKAAMWGASIVGFGSYHYKYPTGREGDWFITGFSPRKGNLTLYMMVGFERFQPLLKKLGKHKLGRSCLYLKTLASVDEGTLEELLQAAYQQCQKLQAQAFGS
jgi:hypothetical protein